MAVDVKTETKRLAHRGVERALSVMLSPYRFFKFLCFSLGLFVLTVSLGAGILVYLFLKSLPDLSKTTFQNLQELAQSRVAAKISDKRFTPKWITLKDISREYLYSIVLSEDATFFEHNGFNFDAMANSLAENLREKKTAFGASTISQQVAKNLFLTTEKTISRKCKEFIITRRLESAFTKNEILEIYLNIAEFGPDLFGAEKASLHYFRKNPSEINAAEGAFISLMLPSPRRHYYNIFRNRNLTRLKRRRIERVLRDMLYEEFITEAQYRSFIRYDYFPQVSRLPAGRPPW